MTVSRTAEHRGKQPGPPPKRNCCPTRRFDVFWPRAPQPGNGGVFNGWHGNKVTGARDASDISPVRGNTTSAGDTQNWMALLIKPNEPHPFSYISIIIIIIMMMMMIMLINIKTITVYICLYQKRINHYRQFFLHTMASVHIKRATHTWDMWLSEQTPWGYVIDMPTPFTEG